MGLLQINKQINYQLERGKSREDIFREMSSKSPKETVKFAYCLASTPYPELRRKYLKQNAVLFLLLLLLAVTSVAAELPIDFQQSTLFIAVKFFVPLIFSYFVFQFHGGIYRLLVLWCSIDLVESLLMLSFTTPFGLCKIIVLLLTILFSVLIAKKVFPNLKMFGPRQDSEGRYKL